MATLAVRLNELASANEQGLLNDDEYRLLRQNVFERYATLGGGAGGMSSVVLAEPLKPATVNLAQPKARKISRRPSEVSFSTTPSNVHPEATLKKSKPHFFSSIIHRATSPLKTPSGSPPALSVSRSLSLSSSSSHASAKKFSNTIRSTSSSRISSEITSSQSVSVPNQRHLLSTPTSPTRTNIASHSSPPKSFRNPLQSNTSAQASSTSFSGALSAYDIFEDGGLFTTADIRQAIVDLDQDAKRVVQAFDEMEESAVRRTEFARLEETSSRRTISPLISSTAHLPLPNNLHYQPRSNSAASALSRTKSTTSLASSNNIHTSPTGPTLRKKGSMSSLASSLFSLKTRPSMPSFHSTPSSVPMKSRSRSDSVASTSSVDGYGYQTSSYSDRAAQQHSFSVSSLSSSKLIPSRRGMSRPSLTMPSTESLSGSRRPSTSTSGGRLSTNTSHGYGYSATLSRSTASVSRSGLGSGSVHWGEDSAEPVPARSGRSTRRTPGGKQGHGQSGREEDSDGVERGGVVTNEILQIRKRRKDVIGRYESRREYLKARLRGAELHERVLKGR
ncbi:hypothetical protein D9757_002405 [Collybiopsis confluens]|uniref:Uncharacterized protein n=1 Tax=Collybiopsis confluens TaxID=2823264 RepID=A0A8H5HXX7_9AGAR|nr:hypothetical protein D9757_002405 [Collybiopsis confluens]